MAPGWGGLVGFEVGRGWGEGPGIPESLPADLSQGSAPWACLSVLAGGRQDGRGRPAISPRASDRPGTRDLGKSLRCTTHHKKSLLSDCSPKWAFSFLLFF